LSTATPSLSDSRLTGRAARGSSDAFEAIFERYHQELYRYCAAIVGNAADAQDAVQSTMVKVLQALPGEERRIELKPWLYRIAHNEAIEIIRRRLPSEEVDAGSLLAPAGTADEVLARERLRRLVADVAELPERQRGALVMRELGGLGFEEIGAALGTSAATARQTLFEARLGLRQMDEGREMDCIEAMAAISGGDRRVLRGRKLRAHLRACESCRAFRAEIEDRRAELAMLAPLPAAAVAGLLQSVLGAGGATGAAGAGAGAAAGGGASAAGTAGAVAGKSLLGATALKTAAAVGVVVAIGVTAADQRGLIHLGSGRSGPAPAGKSAPPSAGTTKSGSAPPSASATAPGSDPGPRATGNADLAASSPAKGAAADRNLAHGHPKPHPAATTPSADSGPAHADNGNHLGRLEHPEHGYDGAAQPNPRSHGKSASAPGQAKPKATKHKAAPGHVAPGRAKKHAPEKPAAPAAEPVKPADPGPPGKQATSAEPPAEAHGKPAAEATISE
jgi:RNA polymerase sigma factor (sigma-70 family)